jgi:hypothetical protein
MNAFIARCLAVLAFLPALAGQAQEFHARGRLPASDSHVTLWWALSSAARIQPDSAPPEEQTPAVQIRCARNEHESVQVVVRPAKPLRQLTLGAGPFSRPGQASIAATNLEVLQALYLHVTSPTDKSTKAGWWPDPLVPVTGATDLEAGTNQAFWLRLFVPRTAAAGVYHSALHLRAEGWSAEVPLELTVYGFALPERMSCQTAFGFSPGEVFRYQGVKSDAAKREVLEKYWADLAASLLTP